MTMPRHPMDISLQDRFIGELKRKRKPKHSLPIRVKQLIEGFETPYGMELLSTIHWIVKHDPDINDNLEAIEL